MKLLILSFCRDECLPPSQKCLHVRPTTACSADWSKCSHVTFIIIGCKWRTVWHFAKQRTLTNGNVYCKNDDIFWVNMGRPLAPLIFFLRFFPKESFRITVAIFLPLSVNLVALLFSRPLLVIFTLSTALCPVHFYFCILIFIFNFITVFIRVLFFYCCLDLIVYIVPFIIVLYLSIQL